MEKKDLKTLALLGMAGGMLLSAQAINANEDVQADYSNYLAAQGCASCGSRKQAKSNKNAKDSEVADTYQPSGHGCGGYSNPSYYSQPSGSSQGCGGQNQPYYYNQPSGSYEGQGGQMYYDNSQGSQNYNQQTGQAQYPNQASQPRYQNQQWESTGTTPSSQNQYQQQPAPRGSKYNK